MSTEKVPVGYIAYIDEAGDDGIKSRNDGGSLSSQWMVMAAVVIKAEREHQVVEWVKNIVKNIGQHQISHLHFRNLNDNKKRAICLEIARLDLRIFVVLSHKRNMLGYRNLNAQKSMINKTAFFYCWMSRLLLETVTAYCGRRTKTHYNEVRSLRIEFSDRGGVNLEGIKNYYMYLREQSKLGIMYNDAFDLDWSVFDENELYFYPNKMRAGLQLADIAASAFFSGLEPIRKDGSTKPEFAKLLEPRIAMTAKGKKYGFGVRTMPRWIPDLPPEQAELRDYYIKK